MTQLLRLGSLLANGNFFITALINTILLEKGGNILLESGGNLLAEKD